MSKPVQNDAAMKAALAIIEGEHKALAGVVYALQRLAHDVREDRAKPDFALFSAMLYYIDAFPERQHHPKEDEHLFKALRARTARADAVLDELQGEHVRSAQLVAYLAQTLVHYQGGAPRGREAFCAAVDAYATLVFDHVRKEEDVVLKLAAECLTVDDWRAIETAFRAHQDPLLGPEPGHEFRRLRRRIANLAPRKLQSLLHHDQ